MVTPNGDGWPGSEVVRAAPLDGPIPKRVLPRILLKMPCTTTSMFHVGLYCIHRAELDGHVVRFSVCEKVLRKARHEPRSTAAASEIDATVLNVRAVE